MTSPANLPHTVDPTADRPPTWLVVDVVCPKCHAKVGESCATTAPAPSWHPQRLTEMTRQAQITSADWRAQRVALGLPVPGPGR